MQLIIDTRGTYIKKRNDCFFIKNDSSERIISPERIESIAILNSCMLSTSAIELAIKHQLPIYIMDAYGDIKGTFWNSQLSHYNNLRRLQILRLENEAFRSDWMHKIFELKTNSQIKVISELSKQHGHRDDVKNTLERIQEISIERHNDRESHFESERARIMGLEGSIARYYWQQLSDFLPQNMKFEKRSRRPALDPFNALINYAYGMTYRKVEQSIFAAGLDPTFGFMHRDQEDESSLSFDLIEPFRPLLDVIVVEHVISGELTSQSAIQDDKLGYIIRKEIKRELIRIINDEYKREREMEEKVMSIEKHIFRMAEEFAGDIRNKSV